MIEDFESYLTARNHYRKYRELWEDPSMIDETENLPPGIYASIVRHQPTHPDDLDDEDLSDPQDADGWTEIDELLDALKGEES